MLIAYEQCFASLSLLTRHLKVLSPDMKDKEIEKLYRNLMTAQRALERKIADELPEGTTEAIVFPRK